MNNRIPPHKRTIPTVVIFLLLTLSYFVKVGAVKGLLPWVEAISVVSLPDASRSVVGGWLHSVEVAYPLLSMAVAYAMIIVGAAATMRMTISHNLYDRASYTPLMIYLAVSAALASSAQILAPAVAGLLMVMSLYECYAGYSRHENTHNIFSGCFYIGLIALVYPAAAILWLLIFAVMILFERSGRELIVSAAAVVTPLVMQFYLGWFFGEQSISQQLLEWRVAFAFPHRAFVHLFDGGIDTLHIASTISTVVVFIVLSIFAVTHIDRISIALMARTRIVYSMFVALASLLMILVPSFTLGALSVAAPAFAISLSAALFEIKGMWTMWIYLLIMAISILV